jgi:N6-adenosine-specific RNA methylase IME4
LLLLGTRGAVPAPAPGDNWRSVIAAPVGEHSQKPDIVYDLIEAYFPTLPKIEMNARRARPGWDRWGFDAPVTAEPGSPSAATAPRTEGVCSANAAVR